MTPDEIKAARAELNLTAAELAEKLGVHLRTVQKWEGAERKVPGTVARLVAVLLAERRARVGGQP